MEDCHREKSGIVKDVPMQTSVPSTIGDDHYEGVHPVTVSGKDCRRLVIGTKTCDVFVTSCLRLGIGNNAPVSVGADTLNFEIPESEVEHIRIFLDCEQAKIAKNMVGKSVPEITKNKGIESLRQLKTKFSELDTLSRKEVMRDLEMCRGSKEFLAPFEKIALLFGQEQEIAIIGNEVLGARLKDLAEPLSRKVADANTKAIKVQVQALFGVVVIKE
ncbi:hypothetical protein BGX34_004127 [Mortierella sp. NVP85]|nr:hypothetical protein BGX34_004127 [Mortierella sp. NVP85]